MKARGAPRRVVFVNRYFRPDESATAQLLGDLALELAQRGEPVSVICSRQRYDDPGARLPRRECLAGVEVHRAWSSRFGRAGLAGRAIDYLTFYLSSAWLMCCLLRPGDVLVAKTDPPLLSVPAALAARLRGARLVNWLQDLFPEVAAELGIRLPRPVQRLLLSMRDASLRAAEVNVVLGTCMAERLQARGIAPAQTRIVANWAELDPPRPKPVTASRLRARLGLQDRFVVAYSGNLGRAHDFSTMLAAAQALQGEGGPVFLMIGGGAGMQRLRLECEARRLQNVLFLPYQPRESLPDALAAADVHWLSLQASLEGLIVPSKFYGILAAGRPAVFVGASDGELAREIRAAGCGAVIPIGDPERFAALLRDWQRSPQLLEQLGAAGRRRYLERYAAANAFDAWQQMVLGSRV